MDEFQKVLLSGVFVVAKYGGAFVIYAKGQDLHGGVALTREDFERLAEEVLSNAEWVDIERIEKELENVNELIKNLFKN